jgi:hypothetical protein
LIDYLISGHRGRKTNLHHLISVQLGTFQPRLTIETPLNGPKEGLRESGGETLTILHCRHQPISITSGQGTGTELEPLQLLTKVIIADICVKVKQCHLTKFLILDGNNIWENEDDKELWEDEQKRLDREWYQMDEGYDDIHNPFSNVSEDYTKKKEEQHEQKKMKRMSAQQRQINKV